jgi:hypothetical protein
MRDLNLFAALRRLVQLEPHLYTKKLLVIFARVGM